MDFKSSLIREKFIIRDVNASDDDDGVIALSNRMVVPLHSKATGEKEEFVVRAQNMHSCVRFAAMIVKEFQDKGPLMQRKNLHWGDLWAEVTKGYEGEWNPLIWGVVYHKGRVVFEYGERHAFLDIIEKCDAANKDDYSKSIPFAEDAFKAAGKDVTIHYDSNIALVVSFTKQEAKCGVILRSAQRTTTFNFNARPRSRDIDVKVSQSLTVSAAFLEGIQLAFQVGMYNRKLANGLIDKFSDEDRKGKRSLERMNALNSAITKYEQTYDVTYRPERPAFSQAITKAEEMAQDILAPLIEEKFSSGEFDESEWIK